MTISCQFHETDFSVIQNLQKWSLKNQLHQQYLYMRCTVILCVQQNLSSLMDPVVKCEIE